MKRKHNEDNEDTEEIEQKQYKKQICQYGSKCYRKNLFHLAMYDHPANINSSSVVVQSVLDSTTIIDRVQDIYLTKISESKINNFQSINLSEILSLHDSKMIKSAQFNYMIDCKWLISKYTSESRKQPILLVHGGNVELHNESQANIESCKANLPIPFGTHHTKMMLLLYEDGLRVVIHTANLIKEDWDCKTQCVWMSPIFPLMQEDCSDGDSVTGFRRDLMEYLCSYNNSMLTPWIDIVRKHNFSCCRVFLISSSPGRHRGATIDRYGHMKLRRVLSTECEISDQSQTVDLIAQFSSIGSLGPSESSWLTSEFQTSLEAVKRSTTSSIVNRPRLHLIYPCLDDVRESLEGYMAGASLPYSSKVHCRQLWLQKYLRKWRATRSNRTRASPHMKSYARTSSDGKVAHWFMVTSANLSKAAWGGMEKKQGHLMIRSYEVGVLLLPQYYGAREFVVGGTNGAGGGGGGGSVTLDIPYDLPCTDYGDKDDPWMVDLEQGRTDSCGLPNDLYQSGLWNIMNSKLSYFKAFIVNKTKCMPR